MRRVFYTMMIAATLFVVSCGKQGSVVDGQWSVAGVELQNWNEYFELYKNATKAQLDENLAKDATLQVTDKMKAKEKAAVEAAKVAAAAKNDSIVAALDAQAEAMKAEFAKMFEGMVFTFNADGTYNVNGEEGTFAVSEDMKTVTTTSKDSVQTNYAVEVVEGAVSMVIEKAFAKDGQAEALNAFVHKAKVSLVAKQAE